MQTTAVVLDKPCSLGLSGLNLVDAGPEDVIVDVLWTGISTGTEKLMFEGSMPHFPGMGYPLVPGYEAVGTIAEAGAASGRQIGETVFVPGARCFEGVNGLFGAAASRVVVKGSRVHPIPESMGHEGVLLALAATAHHALALPKADPPDLIVGHGVLGRLLARTSMALGNPPPTVWEINPARRQGSHGYPVCDSSEDGRAGYRAIIEASGDATVLDTLVSRLLPGGAVTLAGFYHSPLSFTFPQAFMREATIRIAAEFKPGDVAAVLELIAGGDLALDGLITHQAAAADATQAYRTAFSEPTCLKMTLDWRHLE